MPTPNAPPDAAVARFQAGLLDCGCAATGATYGICVSGGPDSLALLLLAKAASLAIRAATVDHGLRPQSRAEASHVAQCCAQLGIPHDILTLGPVGRGNRSDWARTARYSALRDWAKRESLSMLITAHHADDQLETMLMRLNRGAGVAGLAGVRMRQVDLCRPLLGWRKTELVDIVTASGLIAVDDPTNRDDSYDRARIRKRLVRADWLDPAAAAISAAALADANEALDWTTAMLLAAHLTEEGATLRLSLPPIPRELARRVLSACIVRLNPAARMRGTALDRLLSGLQAGKTATLAGVKCSGGACWRFTHAAPRRTK